VHLFIQSFQIFLRLGDDNQPHIFVCVRVLQVCYKFDACLFFRREHDLHQFSWLLCFLILRRFHFGFPVVFICFSFVTWVRRTAFGYQAGQGYRIARLVVNNKTAETRGTKQFGGTSDNA
jgi:hypothetical protein